jgi:hypothetical protein
LSRGDGSAAAALNKWTISSPELATATFAVTVEAGLGGDSVVPPFASSGLLSLLLLLFQLSAFLDIVATEFAVRALFLCLVR